MRFVVNRAASSKVLLNDPSQQPGFEIVGQPHPTVEEVDPFPVQYRAAMQAGFAFNATLAAYVRRYAAAVGNFSLSAALAAYVRRYAASSGSFSFSGTLSATGFLSESVALFSAMSVQPSVARKVLIDTLIRALKTAGVWDALDVLYVLAAHDAQAGRINWKSPGSFTAALVNAPAFATDRGYAGDGSSSYLDTGWIPSAHGVNFTLNEAGVWVWNLTDTQVSASDAGTQDGGGLTITPRPTTNRMAGRLNDSSVALFTMVSDALGLSGVSRRGSNYKLVWKDGVAQNGSATPSTAVPATSAWIGGANATGFSTHQIAAAAFGGSLNGLELSFYNAMLAYMQGVGAA